MAISADSLRDHIEYTAWASARLLEAASRLSPDELTRDFGTSDRTVLGTLAHVFGADRVWLARVTGAPQHGLSELDRELPTLLREWPGVHDGWRDWARAQTDTSILAVLDYTDLRGNPWRQSLWQIILHVVNHATHHRGQVSGFLRSMGHTPPAIDLIAYYREVERQTITSFPTPSS
jgi:uncharacterized damage-inducible protein DinB